jgi:hypothetical protein
MNPSTFQWLIQSTFNHFVIPNSFRDSWPLWRVDLKHVQADDSVGFLK